MINPKQHKTKKRFGQHFLHDQQIIKQIVNSVQKSESQTLVEIGPGQGAITMPLLDKFKRLNAIELDRDLIEPLTHSAQHHGELTIINQDILNVDFASLFENQNLSVVGNLPYNISTPLLFHLMSYSDMIDSMVFMVQQEVAQRIAADVGTKAYGRLSVMMQYYCHTNYLFHVPPSSFKPPPKVDSAVIQMVPKLISERPKVDKEQFDLVVKAAFSQRRKTIRNSLSGIISDQVYKEASVDPKLRAENLSLEQFVTLAQMS